MCVKRKSPKVSELQNGEKCFVVELSCDVRIQLKSVLNDQVMMAWLKHNENVEITARISKRSRKLGNKTFYFVFQQLTSLSSIAIDLVF